MKTFSITSINEESGYLLNDDVKNSNLCKEEVGVQKIMENRYKQFSKSTFIFKFFIFIFFISIILLFVCTLAFLRHKPNFRIEQIKWDTPDLDDRKYENYIFDNGLEVMIIQDPNFNRDGGSIVIESGYMDNPYNEGIDTFATHLLSHIIFPNKNNISNLKDYYGHYSFDCGEYLTTYLFDILNSGFIKFLSDFSLILNSNFSENYDTYFMTYEEEILNEMNNIYNTYKKNVDYRELHLIEYLVFGLKNEEGKDIFPKGNPNSLKKYSHNELKSKVKEYIEQLIDPQKIKIVLFSRYKTSISSKYMKNYFKFLTTMEKPKNLNNNKFVIKEFKKSQIIFLNADYYDINYIDILYYIDKINSESFSELFYKASYLNYIIDFLKEKKKGSLYYLLTNSSNHNIREIFAGYQIIFKSKIEFYIYIQLNTVKNINNIIYLTYQFMNKIVKQAIGNNTQFDRYIELKNQYYQDLKYSEKAYNTIKLAKDNADSLIQKRFAQKYFFYNKYIPWNDTISYNDNLDIIKNETYYYLKQLKPENSVIVLSLKIKNIEDLTCNATSPFYLDCEKIKSGEFNKSEYYEISFKNDIFNSSFEKSFDIDDNADISFIKNNYTSKHNGTYINQEEEDQ
jgi:secreted Zn-dependent insulinase-like peptidase